MHRPAWVLLALCACAGGNQTATKQELAVISGDGMVSASFHCGDSVTTDAYTVTSEPVADGCGYFFHRTVTIATPADYAPAAWPLEAVDLEVLELQLTDAETGADLLGDWGLRGANISVEGDVLFSRSMLRALPKTARLESVELPRDAIAAQQDVVLNVSAMLLVPGCAVLPKQMKVRFRLQPTLVFGPQ